MDNQRYHVEIGRDCEWTVIATFSEKTYLESIIAFAETQYRIAKVTDPFVDDICIIDSDTEEVLWDWYDFYCGDDEMR